LNGTVRVPRLRVSIQQGQEFLDVGWTKPVVRIESRYEFGLWLLQHPIDVGSDPDIGAVIDYRNPAIEFSLCEHLGRVI
jgi:hypothetical protein